MIQFNFNQILILTLLAALCSQAGAEYDRFIPLDASGQPIAPQIENSQEWPCVYDRKTGLIWEAKTQKPGLHYRFNTYSWFNPDPAHNGGLAGEPGGNQCRNQPCDTHAFVQAVNTTGLCNARDWRLPTREELRSLVDYTKTYPGPTLNQNAFPNAVAQFYWSANPDATEPGEAWGIGFAFGFDYAYYKSNQVPVRLVRQESINLTLVKNQ